MVLIDVWSTRFISAINALYCKPSLMTARKFQWGLIFNWLSSWPLIPKLELFSPARADSRLPHRIGVMRKWYLYLAESPQNMYYWSHNQSGPSNHVIGLLAIKSWSFPILARCISKNTYEVDVTDSEQLGTWLLIQFIKFNYCCKVIDLVD